jgi:HD superfamily phosphodiesterase
LITKIKNRKKHLTELHKNILDIIGEIINDEEFKKLKNHRHHVFFNRYEHLINASVISYKMAKLFKADIRTCTLAGVLHDYHFTKIKSYKH